MDWLYHAACSKCFATDVLVLLGKVLNFTRFIHRIPGCLIIHIIVAQVMNLSLGIRVRGNSWRRVHGHHRTSCSLSLDTVFALEHIAQTTDTLPNLSQVLDKSLPRTERLYVQCVVNVFELA